MEELIRIRLTEILQPLLLIIENQSALHQHHSSSPQTGQSHFHIKIQAKALAGLTRVRQQQAIYRALGDAFTQGLHAISIEIIQE